MSKLILPAKESLFLAYLRTGRSSPAAFLLHNPLYSASLALLPHHSQPRGFLSGKEEIIK